MPLLNDSHELFGMLTGEGFWTVLLIVGENMRFHFFQVSVAAGAALLLAVSPVAFGGDANTAFKVFNKTSTIADVAKEDQSTFYDIEKKKYELIEGKAHEAYLEAFWAQMAKDKGSSVEAVRREYFDKNIKVSEKEVSATLEKFKDHPQLSKLSKKEQEGQVRDYLKDRDTRELMQSIIDAGIKKGDLVVLYPEPEEPVYKITVSNTDHVRYGPNDTDTKPVGCAEAKCPITVVEYSEFQCPFCSKVVPDVKRVLTEYKGKIRWIVRDYPLSFHDRARPAAIAAKCASFQDKYWSMYSVLFQNQQSLGDSDLEKYGAQVGLDKNKYAECIKNPGPAEELIESNFQSGARLGVSGTPAFFINGRRLSGALPFAEFRRVIEDELSKVKKG
jgi:protein-disulfide isomerase